jgi:hypothetical protein
MSRHPEGPCGHGRTALPDALNAGGKEKKVTATKYGQVRDVAVAISPISSGFTIFGGCHFFHLFTSSPLFIFSVYT